MSKRQVDKKSGMVWDGNKWVPPFKGEKLTTTTSTAGSKKAKANGTHRTKQRSNQNDR